jgi:hypothetical protein
LPNKMADEIDGKISQSESRINEEQHERESKRLCVVLHGVEEVVGTERSREKRAVLDAKMIATFFAFLELDLSEEDVKSSGEFGREENRPEP